ncbi:hypothetical protein [Pseudoxanthomonas winnipegensis]|jgi:hypothetical protein|nr:hypothetical protein [Pseudoxanthomonas winnipegensis]
MTHLPTPAVIASAPCAGFVAGAAGIGTTTTTITRTRVLVAVQA